MKFSRLLLITLVFIAFTSYSQDEEYDRQLGEETSKKIEMAMGLYDSHSVSNYVDSIGQILVSVYGPQPFDFTFHVIDSEEPNAFALPGGYIYVSRGLLMITINEDELACVLAHEIIHAIERHGVKSQKRNFWTSLVLLPANILGAVGGQGMQALMSIPLAGGELINASYSRGHEKEADKSGLKLAHKAGYNPFALANVLERLSATVEVLTGQEEKFTYFDSHPFTAKRAKYINELAEKENRTLERDPTAEYDYLTNLDGVVVGQNPEGGIINGTSFSHPDLDVYFKFPEKWQLANAPVGVTGMQPNGEALLYFTFESDSLQIPNELGNYYDSQLKKESTIKILKSTEDAIDGMPAYYLAFLEESNPYMHYHLCWVRDDTITYRFTGIGKDTYIQDIKSSMYSFRKLSDQELNSFAYKKLKTITAGGNESFKDIMKRENDQLPFQISSVINGIEEDQKVSSGYPVKVVYKEPYRGD